MQRSYSDAAARAFPLPPPASAAVVTARDAVDEEIVLTSHQPASANNKAEASRSCIHNQGSQHATFVGLPSRRGRACCGRWMAATISVLHRVEILNIVKTPDHMTSTLDKPRKLAVASPASIASLPTPRLICGSSAKAVTPLRLDKPPATEVVGGDDIDLVTLPLSTTSSRKQLKPWTSQ